MIIIICEKNIVLRLYGLIFFDINLILSRNNKIKINAK